MTKTQKAILSSAWKAAVGQAYRQDPRLIALREHLFRCLRVLDELERMPKIVQARRLVKRRQVAGTPRLRGSRARNPLLRAYRNATKGTDRVLDGAFLE